MCDFLGILPCGDQNVSSRAATFSVGLNPFAPERVHRKQAFIPKLATWNLVICLFCPSVMTMSEFRHVRTLIQKVFGRRLFDRCINNAGRDGATAVGIHSAAFMEAGPRHV